MPFSVRFVAVALACGALAFSLPALAEGKKDKQEKDTATKPALVASYDDWSVYHHGQSGKARVCYTLASPKTRDPEDLKRDAGYAFISERPGEHVRNEVSFVMGFEIGTADADKPSPDKNPDKKKSAKDKKPKFVTPTATIGESQFELMPKGGDLWVKNAAQEGQFIDEMRRGSKLEIRVSSKKGVVTTDTYSLTGFKQAIDRATKDCPAG